MSILSINFKYLIFSFVLIVAGFAFTPLALAGTYTHICSDGGSIITNASLPQTSISANTYFTVTATVYSSGCGTRDVNVSAQNNALGSIYIIPTQSLAFNSSIGPVNDSVNFTSPGTGGSYNVYFVTGVEEPAILYPNTATVLNGPSGSGSISSIYIDGTTSVDWNIPGTLPPFGEGNSATFSLPAGVTGLHRVDVSANLGYAGSGRITLDGPLHQCHSGSGQDIYQFFYVPISNGNPMSITIDPRALACD